jgi:hypothetical protein
MPFLLSAHLIDIEIMLCDSFESGTLKKYRGGDTAVIVFSKCGSDNGTGRITAVVPWYR